MDKEYLNKVIDQLVRETRIDYDYYMVLYPFNQPITFNKSFYLLSVSNLFSPSLSSSFLISRFINHCEEVYGLNKDEVKYVWDKYRYIINNKI